MDDSKTAKWLERAGKAAQIVGPMLGPKGAIAMRVARSILDASADAIRNRGASTDELVASLRTFGPPKTPWNEGPPS